MNLKDIKLIGKHSKLQVVNCLMLGINKPLINMKIENADPEVEFFAFADDEQIILDTHVYPGNGNYVLEAAIPLKTRIVTIVAQYGKEYFLVKKVKNSKVLRIFNKFKNIMNRFFDIFKRLGNVMVRGIRFLWREHHFLVPPALWAKYFKHLVKKLSKNGPEEYHPFHKDEYHSWIAENEIFEKVETFEYNPLISILIPVYNVDKQVFADCMESILNQTYQNFEICLTDDCSTKQETKDILAYYEKKDARIKIHYRKENGHISKATNDALKMAEGEFVALVDNDDVLTLNALYENVKVLNENLDLDMIYSDEDKLDLQGRRCEPHFKPDFAPDTLLSSNYICHFTVLRKSIMDEIGGFTIGLEGAQDYDLFLRFSEKTTPDKIYHIAKILYHWRMVKGSTSMTVDNKGYAIEKGKKCVENALARRGIKGWVEAPLKGCMYRVHYEFDVEPSVSVIIPTRDYADITEACLKSVFEKTKYTNYEVILVDNNSVKEETFALFDHYKKQYSNFRVVKADMEFNYSAINNLAVKQSNADVIVLLNNDTEVISSNWLKDMVGYAKQEHIGTVGPKLLYPDTTVQHAGVVIGFGGVAVHAHLGEDKDEFGMHGRLQVPYNFTAVTAACLAVERKKFDEVCGLEEELMVAYNDMDFNLKLAEKGYYNVCIPFVELYHHESKSRGLDTTSEKYKRFLFESEYMYKKWEKYMQKDPMYNVNFSKDEMFMLPKKKKK